MTSHDTSTSCSWLSPSAGFLSTLTRRRPRGEVFRSGGEWIEALLAYVALNTREYPKPYQWRGRNAEDLIAQHDRLLLVLHTAQAEVTC